MSNGLIVLDINGVLGRKVSSDIDGDVRCRSWNFLLQPGVKEFVEKLQSKYDVAIYSSTTYHNAKKIVSKVFTANRPVFAWYRDRTKYDREMKDHSTIKLLSDVIDSPGANPQREYTLLNTVIVDDSINKLRYNNPNNVVICDLDTMSYDDLYSKIVEALNNLSLLAHKDYSPVSKRELNRVLQSITKVHIHAH